MLRMIAAVVLSGAASLMYQVAWTRRLISETSATVTAQAIILAVFMAGLGLGSWWAAPLSRRIRRPLRGYAVVEVSAAGFAVLSIPLIGASRHLRAALDGGGMWLQLALVALFLLLPTTLLGASLPLVVEEIDRGGRPDRAVRSVGILYGANTLGAAAGCFVAGFVAIERLGLRATTLVGAALATLAAGMMMTIRASAAGIQGEARLDREEALEPRWIWWAALTGFIGLGSEVLFTRMFASVVYNTVYVFTEVLLGVLIGIAAGGFIAATVTRRATGDFSAYAARAAGMLQLMAAVFLALVPTFVLATASGSALQSSLARGSSVLLGTSFVAAMATPMALTAAVLPLLVAVAARTRSARALAILYAANTAGGVVGSLMIGLLLLPATGLHASLAALVMIGLAVGGSLLASERKRALRLAGLASLTALVLLASYRIPADTYRALLPEDHEILELQEGAAGDAMVTDDSAGRRRLWLNSAWVATAGGGTGYGHQVFGHLPALLHPMPERALGIALGTGQTFAAIVSHGIDRFDCVEINPSVVSLSRKWFREANGGLLDRPQVVLRIDDGRAFLRATSDRYDLLVLEPLQAWSAGTSSLYSEEFYRDAQRVLEPDGVLLQWIPFYGQGADETKAMVRSGQAVFPHASLWLAGTEGILILHPTPVLLDPDVLGARIASRGMAETFARYGLREGADLLSHLILGPSGVRAWVEDAEVITDDRPFLEFAAARQLDRDTTLEIVESLAEPAARDDLSDYLASTSTRGAAALAEVRSVRATMLAAWRVPYFDRAKRADVLEAGLREAPGSDRLRAYHRAYIESWIKELEHRGADAQEIEAVRRRADEAVLRDAAGSWSAGLDRYDYLESIELEPSGRGSLAWGWDQLVRYEGTLRHRIDGDEITLEYDDPAGTKTLAFELRSGDFVFEQETPAGKIEIRCKRELRFSRCPFPDGLGTATAFYADCRSS